MTIRIWLTKVQDKRKTFVALLINKEVAFHIPEHIQITEEGSPLAI